VIYFPERYQLDSGSPLLSLTFDQAGGDLTSESVVFGDVIFDQIAIEPTIVDRQPSSFSGGFFVAEEDGILSVDVGALSPDATGRYSVRIVDLGLEPEDDFPDLVSDSDIPVLAINEAAAGRIENSGDRDLVQVALNQGTNYEFSVRSFADGLGTLAQAELRLLDGDGRLVSVGRFDSETGRTELQVGVFEGGQYFLEVRGAPIEGNVGTYTLESRESASSQVDDDIAEDTQTSASLVPGQSRAGEIEVAGDRDWIKVTLEANKVYLFDVLGTGKAGNGSLADAELRILSAGGSELAFDDDSGAGKDARLQFTPGASGEYFLDIGGGNGESGSYTVRVSELFTGEADPLRSAQWYLDALGVAELGGELSGAGVVVSIVDDGVDSAHPDLAANYLAALAYDTQFDVADGSPKYPRLPGQADNHGTLVAGVIGAVGDNQVGIRGVAPDVGLTSTRIKWSWDQVVEAMGRQDAFDISTNAWSAATPFADDFNSSALSFAYDGLRASVENGRSGLGTVFVFSAGNGAGLGDDTNTHNFQNAREVITVGSVDRDGSASAASTPGANVLVSAFGEEIITTDRSGLGLGENGASDYLSTFSGSSAAASAVSGVIALMLEANPELGYRDVAKILAATALNGEGQSWKSNGAKAFNGGGLQFNDKSGFGVVDAYAAVQLAKTWQLQSTALNEASAGAQLLGLKESIPDASSGSLIKTFEITSELEVERVELGVDLSHGRLGDLVITLTSPSGTVSTLLNRPSVNDERPFGLSGEESPLPKHLLWDFSSVQFLGEDAAGTWTVEIRDLAGEEVGELNSLSLRVFGDNGPDDTYVFTDEGFLPGAGGIIEDVRGEDSINAAAVRGDVLVDLAGGAISSSGVAYEIASWTEIENAFTGRGNDMLVGTDADNILVSGKGNDVLRGGLGNDLIDGGDGSDTAEYSGLRGEYSITWNPEARTITVVDNKASNGDEGVDVLRGVETLLFADGTFSLGETVGNAPPSATTAFFDQPVVVGSGQSLALQLPEDLFTDPDAAPLEVAVEDAAGGELPEWLEYDPNTGAISGTPPEGFLGQVRLKVEAADAFGETASGVLVLQFGDNQAPVVDEPRELVVNEDSGLTALGISAPTDPEGTVISVRIDEIPENGVVIDKAGNAVLVGQDYTADELSEFSYQTEEDFNGVGGFLRYSATDEDGVSSVSSVYVFVDPVNDAPRFATVGSELSLSIDDSTDVPLDLLFPSDPESLLTLVEVVGLPELGTVFFEGRPVVLGDRFTSTDLKALTFTLEENVNGPIGGLTIRATDPEGAATDWTLALVVQGNADDIAGTAGDDELFGSTQADTLRGQGGNDTLVGNGGDDRLLGGLGNDVLLGGRGDDELDGSAGNDYLDGGEGADVLAGGPGQDVYVVDDPNDVVLEVIAGGAGGEDLVITSISLTAPTNIEALQAAEGFVVDLSGNALDNQLIGNEADNVLEGQAGRDFLFGEDGNDTLDGGAGVDTLSGGEGDDTYFVDSRADRVIERNDQGFDTVFAATSYTLSSNVENLVLLEGGNYTAGGNSLDNHLIGNSGDNFLAGGVGADVLEGGLGNDTYILSDDLDTIIDTGGVDTIRSSLDVYLPEGIENAELVGVADTVAIGNAADNLLRGNMANNILDGGEGADTLFGGQGGDQFVIASNGQGVGLDSILDFSAGEDLLVLDLLSFGIEPNDLGILSSGLISADSLVIGAGVVAAEADDYFLFDTDTGVFSIDPDGSGELAPIEIAKISLFDESIVLTAGDVFVAI